MSARGSKLQTEIHCSCRLMYRLACEHILNFEQLLTYQMADKAISGPSCPLGPSKVPEPH